MTEETRRPENAEADSNAGVNVIGTVFIILLFAALVGSLAYFVVTVVIPGIAAGLAQFSAMGSQGNIDPMFR